MLHILKILCNFAPIIKQQQFKFYQYEIWEICRQKVN
jgi:hypothetical protein